MLFNLYPHLQSPGSLRSSSDRPEVVVCPRLLSLTLLASEGRLTVFTHAVAG